MSPIYDYRCESCGFTTDILRSMDDETPATCPVCDHVMARVPSIPSPPTGCPTQKFYPNRW